MTWYASAWFAPFADVNGKARIVVPPVVKDGHTLIESRSHEAFGHAVAWNDLSKRVFISDAPLAWPTDCRDLSSPFGWRVRKGSRQFHGGVDFPVVEGTPVRAVLPGKLKLTGDEGPGKGFGKYLVLDHGDGLFSLYAHLSDDLLGGTKAAIDAGEVIAWSGNTGDSSGPHLHLGLFATSARYPLLDRDGVFKRESAVDSWPLFDRAKEVRESGVDSEGVG